MTTLILPPRHTGDAQRMWRAAGRKGWKVKRAMGWRVEPIRGDVCIYGESLFVRAVAEQLGLTVDEPALDWLTTLPHELVHRELWFGQLADASALPFPRFVKPGDDKAFRAGVYENAAQVEALIAEPDNPTLASEVVHFDSEFRCFAIGHDVLTLSVYARGGEIAGSDQDGYAASNEELAAAQSFATEVLVECPPCHAVVIDVGVLDSGDWAVVEANPCWGSGLYGCSSEAALDVIRAAVLTN